MKHVLILIFVAICSGCANGPFREFQEDADVLRLEHLAYWSGLIEEYYAETGEYPLQSRRTHDDEMLLVEILTQEQRSHSGSPPEHFREVPLSEFLQEIEAGLKRDIDEKYDIQKVPVRSPVGYRYFTTADGYLIWGTCNTCGITEITTLLTDGHTATVNIASERLAAQVPKALTRDAMLSHPLYLKWRARPLHKEQYVRSLVDKTLHDSESGSKAETDGSGSNINF